ncbi:PAS domain S-box protein [Alicyclobacillus sp. SO9]|uniref:PAS domain S-box protein n=1 Tax=Alicyclobacillus sp. SO9 TaxID=2665646 RepID=UPI0018E717A5|nr:PAS domain S-box protein [Alicyclobacillus sp. SO9]QQE77684.1 PAS domain S-box protein [Alicyclobacillus sp. SO9]
MIRDTLARLEKAIGELAEINSALDVASIVAITDVRGNITFANSKFCEISKYSIDELLGQNHRIINSGYHSEAFFKDMWKTIAHGEIWRGEIKNKAKDGTFYWMDTTIVPLLKEDGKPYQYVSFRIDITERKQTEETLDTLISTMPDVVVFKDAEGRWLKANRAALELLNLGEETYQGKTALELAELSTDYKGTLLELEEADSPAWQAAETMDSEQEIVHSNGRVQIFSITRVPVFQSDGKRGGMIVIGKDVTEQKQTEEFLRRSDKVALVGQLAAGIAHEIRNPLAAIKWSIQLLQMDGTETEAQSHEQYDMIMSELDRVDGIVGELLLLAKPHEVHYENMKVHQITKMVVTLMQSQARRNHVELEMRLAENLPEIRCEPNQLKQVLVNLIKNAIEAMPTGGKVEVTGDLLTDDRIRLRVKDEGCGIPQEEANRLGEPFFSTKDKGTGLGLMVSHRIIEDHQGRLDITSEVGKGTIVDVILPTATAFETAI